LVLDRAGGRGFLGDAALRIVGSCVRIRNRRTDVLLLNDSAEGVVREHQSLGGGPRAIVVDDRVIKELLLGIAHKQPVSGE